MAWSKPVTWATTSGPSANVLNQQLKTNLLSLRNNLDWMVRCSKSANQTIGTSNTYTPITFNQHDWTVGTTATHGTASGSKFHAPEPGWWRLMGTLIYASASGHRAVGYQLNGAGTVLTMAQEHVATNINPRELFFSEIVPMTTADYLELCGLFSANTSAQVLGGTSNTRMTWQMVGGAT